MGTKALLEARSLLLDRRERYEEAVAMRVTLPVSAPIRFPSGRNDCGAAVATLALTLASLLGCASDELVSANGLPDRSIALALGQELGLTLQSIGPGEYASPPAISSAALQFIDVVLVTPAVPAGITQRFRFRAAAPGQAVITFQHTGQSATVEDTVNVR